MTYSIDHAAQRLLARGYIQRAEDSALYEFALTAQDTLTDHFAVFGARPVFDTEAEIVALRHMDAQAIQDRSEALQADPAPGIFRGHALSFPRAVTLWFFRKQLDTDLEGQGERSWLTFEEVMRGVAAYYPEGVKQDEAKFARSLQRILGWLTNNGLTESKNSSRGEAWAAHPALRTALGADEMEAFTQQIVEALEKASPKDRQAEEPAEDSMHPDHADSPWASTELETEED